MEIGNITIPVSDFARRIECTVKISGMRIFSIRMSCVIGLIRLAAWIAPCTMKVDVEESSNA